MRPCNWRHPTSPGNNPPEPVVTPPTILVIPSEPEVPASATCVLDTLTCKDSYSYSICVAGLAGAPQVVDFTLENPNLYCNPGTNTIVSKSCDIAGTAQCGTVGENNKIILFCQSGEIILGRVLPSGLICSPAGKITGTPTFTPEPEVPAVLPPVTEEPVVPTLGPCYTPGAITCNGASYSVCVEGFETGSQLVDFGPVGPDAYCNAVTGRFESLSEPDEECDNPQPPGCSNGRVYVQRSNGLGISTGFLPRGLECTPEDRIVAPVPVEPEVPTFEPCAPGAITCNSMESYSVCVAGFRLGPLVRDFGEVDGEVYCDAVMKTIVRRNAACTNPSPLSCSPDSTTHIECGDGETVRVGRLPSGVSCSQQGQLVGRDTK